MTEKAKKLMPKDAAPKAPTGDQWPALNTELLATELLVPYAKNSRTHSAAQVEQIAASIREWGFTNPILVTPDYTIVAGHGRLAAAKKLGLDQVPVIVARGWSREQISAYVIADNKLALNAGWDDEMLAAEVRNLADFSFDVGKLGFDDEELAKLLELNIDVDDDDLDSGNVDVGEDRNLLMVEFSDEAECAAAFEELSDRGWTCKIMS